MRKTWIWVVLVLAGASPMYAQAPMSDSDPASAVVSSSPTTFSRPISVDSSGLWISNSDRSTYVRVHGYVQADNRLFTDSVNREDYDQFLFRRIRPLFEGTLFRVIDFRFMPDFGQNNPQIQEAFLEFKSIPFAKLRVGKFKEPLGLEVLRSDRELTFAERSIASDLVPLRYMGAQLGGSVFSNTISYEVGYFNGSSDGSNGNFTWLPANEGAARVFLRPFAPKASSALGNLGIGVAGSAGSQHGSIAGLKTPGQTTFFKYSSTAVADGQHNRLAPQAYYYWGPLGLMGEYMFSSQEVLNKDHLRRLRNEAWQAAGSFVVTGENNGYDGVRPKYSFEPNKGIRHFGAFELTARYSPLSIDPNTFPLFANPQTAAQRAIERSFGMNWYLNRFVKLVTDYEMTRFRTVASNSTMHSENVLMSRIQLAF